MEDSLKRMQEDILHLRRWNRVLVTAGVICLVALLSGAKSDQSVVKATSIQLISPAGDVRAEISMRNGSPGVYLKDENGVDRVAIYHDSEGSGLHIMDGDAITRIGVVQFAHGGGGVALHGPESRGAAVFYLKTEGSLSFFDKDGQITNQVLASDSSSVD
jgi:hypothetical protein